MKKKLWLLFAGFIIFYILLHTGKQLPGLLHGRSGWVTDVNDTPKWRSIFTDILMGAGFVFSVYFILFYFYPAKKIGFIFCFVPICFIALFLVAYSFAWFQMPGGLRLNIFFRNNVLYFVLYTGFGSSWYFIRYTQYQQLLATATELAARQTELSFLRAQINPHFLFNNLNNIYSLVNDRSAAALPAIAALSEMLRYMLYENEDKVSVSTEINCIRQYLELEKLRVRHSPPVEVMVNGDTDTSVIAPLLLMPLVENAYKHGNVHAGIDWLTITVNVSPNEILFYIVNKKNAHPSPVSGGLGLAQLTKRLELLYPGTHHLKIVNSSDIFSVNLMIKHAD